MLRWGKRIDLIETYVQVNHDRQDKIWVRYSTVTKTHIIFLPELGMKLNMEAMTMNGVKIPSRYRGSIKRIFSDYLELSESSTDNKRFCFGFLIVLLIVYFFIK